MGKRLFLLDGMALVYRAHFALIAKPIYTSKGFNTSAIYGFTQTLLDIINTQNPTHLAVAFDTDAPTPRHAAYKEYKATRQAMPEDLSQAIPHVMRLLDAFNIPVITCDGYEADDIIGTLVRQAEREGFESFMVTPDKDFAQLVTARTLLYRPSRMGDAAELWGVKEVHEKMGVERPEQVIDLKALAGDTSDNIPGVQGVGEKTACKLIAQFGSVDNLYAHLDQVTGKLREKLDKHRDDAFLSKQLATILCDAPCPTDIDQFEMRGYDEEKLKALFVEFEFNTIGRRLFGGEFRASPTRASTPKPSEPEAVEASTPPQDLKKWADLKPTYRVLKTAADHRQFISTLSGQPFISVEVAFDASGCVHGIALSTTARNAVFTKNWMELKPSLEDPKTEKVGHDLKKQARALKRHGIELAGTYFDVMIAHSLLEPDRKLNKGYLAEMYLGASLTPRDEAAQPTLAGLGDDKEDTGACEIADMAVQLRDILKPKLIQQGQERVFYEIESPLLPALASMEHEGIKIDAVALAEFSALLASEMRNLEQRICQIAGREFNLNSSKQLGEVFFDVLKICEKPKKTRTGLYATDEQTLATLAPDHEIVRLLLDYRTATKLKSTYADALPQSISPVTGRVHTTYHQTQTATGRLNSQDPNLQNIPIRTERGQEIRKAFVPRDEGYLLLSCDYSQIELRIIAALSREPGLMEAFLTGADVHTATAAKVFNVPFEAVTAEMRRKAKMVNYGIAYGISAFGLAQRLGIARKEASEIIEQYYQRFSGIRRFMDGTIEFARTHGYVETVTGRRRYIRDIRSANFTTRGSAERNAINAPIQGSAADMIKIAMVNIHTELSRRHSKTRMLLQVHDELVFDLYKPEKDEISALVVEKMKSAIKLDVPVEVEVGVGQNWLEAH